MTKVEHEALIILVTNVQLRPGAIEAAGVNQSVALVA
jgi:hypothetical protein